MSPGNSSPWRRWGVIAGLIAMVACPAAVFAQSPSQPATLKTLSFELVPLSSSQLQSEAGKGVPGGVSGTVIPKSSSGTIKLWDEVPTIRVVPTQASETLTITLTSR
ncbi:MAG TPA: hypothetical protein VF286_13905 [Acidiphilium sp.]